MTFCQGHATKNGLLYWEKTFNPKGTHSHTIKSFVCFMDGLVYIDVSLLKFSLLFSNILESLVLFSQKYTPLN